MTDDPLSCPTAYANYLTGLITWIIGGSFSFAVIRASMVCPTDKSFRSWTLATGNVMVMAGHANSVTAPWAKVMVRLSVSIYWFLPCKGYVLTAIWSWVIWLLFMVSVEWLMLLISMSFDIASSAWAAKVQHKQHNNSSTSEQSIWGSH